MDKGGKLKYFQYILLKWNPNDVLTTCKVIIKGLVSSFVYYHAHDVITKDHRFGEEKKNHGGHCFSLLYFGKLQT